MKTIAVLGATGSVGTQALDVARSRGYRVDLLSANSNTRDMEVLAREFKPRFVVMNDTHSAQSLEIALSDTDIKVYGGDDILPSVIGETNAEVIVNSIIGSAGLRPTLAVIDSGKRLALANKESLVVAGDIVMERAKARGVEILPVDSEHSAIFQSLKAGRESEIKRILLTASGGPFYGKSREELSLVTREETLAHPTWKMGKKITVDSATLMNKGFEIIEAAHLFSVSADRIEVLVHRESILHSAVEYIDNTVIGEMSVPDMRMCVQYAVDYPDRCASASDELDLTRLMTLTFNKPDYEAFPLLALAKRAMLDGGAMPCILNASDEVAVASFLDGKIRFIDIPFVVEGVYSRMLGSKYDTIDALFEIDKQARIIAEKIINSL